MIEPKCLIRQIKIARKDLLLALEILDTLYETQKIDLLEEECFRFDLGTAFVSLDNLIL